MNPKAIIGLIFLGIVSLLGLIVVFGSFYTVNDRERAIVLRNGKITHVATAGLSFKLPIFDSIERFSTETKIVRYEKMQAYSRDQQPADLKVSVNYRLDASKIPEIYSRFGSEEGVVNRLITPRVQEELKGVFGKFNAENAIRQREKLNIDVKTAIAEAISGPVVIEGVQIENIDFSDQYEAAIEQRMQSEIEVERLKQNAAREKVQAEITVTKAKAQADSIEAQAKAEANAITMRGQAEAAAIRAKAEALGQNPHLIGLMQAERWDGKLPTTMPPNASVPMLNMK